MTNGIKSIVFPVKNTDAAKALYATLFGDPAYDTPYYIGFIQVNGVDVGLDPNGEAQGITQPIAYFAVDDINKKLQELTENGATTQFGPQDVGGGRQIARAVDVDGNVIGLLQD